MTGITDSTAIRPRLVGMIHLPPLPGSPANHGDTIGDVESAALWDAVTLQQAGFDAVLVQNSLDRPTRERLNDPLAIAQLTRITTSVLREVDLQVGVNVIKNDGPAAMGIAIATGAHFVRVKILTGAVLSAEGIVQSCADETHRVRQRGDSSPAIWTDVYDPTSRALLADDLDSAVTDALDFGAADAVIITEQTTEGTLGAARRVRERHPDVHLVIGGRMKLDTMRAGLEIADSLIIGTALKKVPGIAGRVDLEVARKLVEASTRS
ncbi:MAG: BtpA/SgcQ family protein [Cryobacterium sp.]|nr:BtpA/SgcQ family protein [Cryobacterium sp.]